MHDILVLTRSDRRPDRVEISPEQLSMASQRAEEIQQKTNRPTRVIGWYHSHPHITVFPSHVGEYKLAVLLFFLLAMSPPPLPDLDVRTQGQFQNLDSGFIGLIFGVFNQDKRTQVRACCKY